MKIKTENINFHYIYNTDSKNYLTTKKTQRVNQHLTHSPKKSK